MTISLCMITKNEEEFLEQCLNSVKELVNEIIIVDTGSTDQTKEIASKFTNYIYDFTWCDDFSAARNESLKHATKDWILFLDADEMISKKDHSKIKELLKIDATGILFIHRNYTNDSNASQWISSKGDFYPESKIATGWYPAPVLRLFRNQPHIKFAGIVHESVEKSLDGKLSTTTIPIHHYGRLNLEKLKQKDELYEELGKKKAQDFYSYFELGRQFAANQKYDQAIETLEKSIELKNNYFESWFMLGSVLLIKNELELALSKLRKAQTLNQNYGPIYANLGTLFAKKKDFQKAIKNFSKAISINPNGANCYKNLGLCYHQMNDKENALLAFKKAIELNPEYQKTIKIN
ncbi:MAG: tetratricopeptide repeat protein [Nanoarchaeota archaeon]|nr:tetratricopeptide repeat protein [Nanoarchaeota archaeon]MBU1623276.1 tetratricopeptide repeat protein [Nanoarchaeota archaeon]